MQFEPLRHASIMDRAHTKAASVIIDALFPLFSQMRLLFDFFPVIAFFAAYKLADMYVATGVLIVACVLQLLIHWLRTRQVNKMHLVTAGLALVFGGVTLLVHDTSFIKWKFTVVNWLFAGAFLASMWRRLSDRPLIQRMMSASAADLPLSDVQWRRLNGVWVAYFLFLGAVNLVALRMLDDDGWIHFKLYFTLAMTAIFIVAQGYWIASRTQGHDKPTG
jgi:intracellular septation protein